MEKRLQEEFLSMLYLKATLFCILALMMISISMPDPCLSREITPNLFKTTLSNGLSVIVKESTRSPVVAVQIWVKAGSSYERPDQWGITHLIEHMIFKGTDTRGPEEIGGAIEAVGGTINAYTSLDYTVYHCVVPRQFWKTALNILSDAVLHASFDEKELQKEKKVVLEEIRMRDDQPTSRLSKILMETAYRNRPYGHPIIGYPKDVSRFTRSDIKAYVKEHYTPSNMTVVIVGDVESSQVFSAVQDAFSSLKKEAPEEPLVEPKTEQKQIKGPRLAVEHMDTEEAYVAMAFNGVPGFSDKDAPIYDVLGAILGEGESSRLVRQLKNRMGLVHTISAYAFTPRLPGLFEIDMSLDPGKLREALSQVFQELFRLKDEGVLEEELKRAKTRVETDFVYQQERMEGEARKLGVFEILAGDPSKAKQYLKRVRAVTADDIKRAAGRTFYARNLSLAMILPQGKEAQLTDKDLGLLVQEAELQAQGLGSSGELSPVRLVRKVDLSNGLTVLIREVPEVPTVAIQIVFPGGVRYETPGDNGVFNFLAAAWTKGTESHSAEGLAEIIEGLGASISGFSGRNTFGLSARCLSKNLDKVLELFGEVLLTPTFPQEEVEKLKPIIISQIKRQDDYLPSVAMRAFNRLLYSPHPYAMDPIGKVETVKSFTSKTLKDLYANFVIPSRAVLAIVGDVDSDELISTLEAMLGGWKKQEQEILPELPRPEPLDRPKLSTITRNMAEQTHIILGFTGPSITSPERYPMEVLSAVLSGMGGRLFQDLRGQEALAYSVTSMVSPGLDYGSFSFYIACTPDKKDKALRGLWKEIYRVLEEPVSEKELERAKSWLIGRYEIGLQTNSAQALDMALNELYGLGYNFTSKYIQAITKVTADDCMKAAQKYLSQDSYVLVTVGP